MDRKQTMNIQCDALRDLVPEGDWCVVAEVMLDVGRDFRNTIDTLPGGNPTHNDLVWCLGANRGKPPREIIAEIVCRVLADKDHEKH